VDDVDYSAAETIRSIFPILNDRGVRLVLAQVMEDVKERSRYELILLFGGHTAYDSLEQVVRAYEDRVG
jgi:hypothetical protein